MFVSCTLLPGINNIVTNYKPDKSHGEVSVAQFCPTPKSTWHKESLRGLINVKTIFYGFYNHHNSTQRLKRILDQYISHDSYRKKVFHPHFGFNQQVESVIKGSCSYSMGSISSCNFFPQCICHLYVYHLKNYISPNKLSRGLTYTLKRNV